MNMPNTMIRNAIRRLGAIRSSAGAAGGAPDMVVVAEDISAIRYCAGAAPGLVLMRT